MAVGGSVRRALIDGLFYGQDPYSGFTPTMAPDLQGWNSDHIYLPEAIDRQRPSIVAEVGVWKGTSVLTMARRMREIGIDGVVIAVDTWLGSSEHWLDPNLKGLIPIMNGFPLLYFVFMSNVVAEGLQDYVLPLPLDSASACEVLRSKNIRPGLLHVDAAHDYAAVTADLERWWSLLQPSGTLIADDYDATHQVWGSVSRAVDDFKARTPHQDFAALPYKCRFKKPPDWRPIPA